MEGYKISPTIYTSITITPIFIIIDLKFIILKAGCTSKCRQSKFRKSKCQIFQNVDLTCQNVDLTCQNVDLTCQNVDLKCQNVDLTCQYVNFTCQNVENLSKRETQVQNVDLVIIIVIQ